MSLFITGPVLIGAGFMTIMFSVEICGRLYKAKKRVQDPDLDNLINPHEVKHWMDPKLIPYGWGLFNEDMEGEKGKIEFLDDCTRIKTYFIFTATHQHSICGGNPSVLIISPSDLNTVIDMQKDTDDTMDEEERNNLVVRQELRF